MESLIGQATSTAIAVTPAREFKHSDRIFDLLLPLLHHDSLHSESQYLREIKLVISASDKSLPKLLASSFPCNNVRDFVKGSCRVSREKLRIRDRLVSIGTSNPFSFSYNPPRAQDAEDSLRYLLQALHRISASEKNQNIGLCVAVYLILLTIHPLRDGNGRSSRFYFASLTRSRLDSPALLLALALTHSGKSSSFHMACKIARLGDIEPALALFYSSAMSVDSHFSEELSLLEEFVVASDTHQQELVTVLQGIRGRLRAYLFN